MGIKQALRGIENRELLVVLTNEEKQHYGEKLAQELKDKTNLELEIDTIKKQFKGRIDAKDATAGDLAARIREGRESRPVDCQWHYDWDRNEKRLVRLDSYETVEIEKIHPWERQLNLDEQETVDALAPEGEAKDIEVFTVTRYVDLLEALGEVRDVAGSLTLAGFTTHYPYIVTVERDETGATVGTPDPATISAQITDEIMTSVKFDLDAMGCDKKTLKREIRAAILKHEEVCLRENPTFTIN
jgi:hypothetical protein